jgi:hypothetical protein
MTRVAVVISLLLLCALQCEASDARTIAPKVVTIETHPDQQFGPVLLRAEVRPLGDDWARISSLTIHWLGHDIAVPSEVYSDLRSPDAASFHCAVWTPKPDEPELEITFAVFDPRYWHAGDTQIPRAHLLIADGRVISRNITWVTRRGEEKHESKKF